MGTDSLNISLIRRQSLVLSAGLAGVYCLAHTAPKSLGWTAPYILTYAATHAITHSLYEATCLLRTYKIVDIQVPFIPIKVSNAQLLRVLVRTCFTASSVYFSFSPLRFEFASILNTMATYSILDSRKDSSAEERPKAINLQMLFNLISVIAIATLPQHRVYLPFPKPTEALALSSILIISTMLLIGTICAAMQATTSWNMENLAAESNACKAAKLELAAKAFFPAHWGTVILQKLTAIEAESWTSSLVNRFVVSWIIPRKISEALKNANTPS